MDIKTILICNAAVTAFLGSALYFYKSNQKTYPGFGFWMSGTFIVTIGYISIVLRGTIAEWVSIIMVNGAFSLAAVLRLEGAELFIRDHRINRWYYSIPVIVMALCAVFYFLLDSIIIRNLIFSLSVTFIGVLIGSKFIHYAPRYNRNVYKVTGTLFYMFGLVMMVRAVMWILHPGFGLFNSGQTQVVYFLAIMIFETGWGMALLMMNSQRLEEDLWTSQNKLHVTIAKLEKAMSEIKTLSGLLPICSSCKKIRDDKGYWNQIESYIKIHTEAEFSHSLCPDCARELYPDYYKGDKKE